MKVLISILIGLLVVSICIPLQGISNEKPAGNPHSLAPVRGDCIEAPMKPTFKALLAEKGYTNA
jgi:hypothetical protein